MSSEYKGIMTVYISELHGGILALLVVAIVTSITAIIWLIVITKKQNNRYRYLQQCNDLEASMDIITKKQKERMDNMIDIHNQWASKMNKSVLPDIETIKSTLSNYEQLQQRIDDLNELANKTNSEMVKYIADYKDLKENMVIHRMTMNDHTKLWKRMVKDYTARFGNIS